MNPAVAEYGIPAPAAILSEMRARGCSLASLACLEPEDVRERLRAQWAFPPNLPHLRALAHVILQRDLSCLSVYRDEYWLTFIGSPSQVPLSIAGRNELPAPLQKQFPVGSVDGLEPFLQHFGGTAERLPHRNYFVRPADYVIVSSDDERYDWGRVDGWAGALKLYQGGGGDCIVMHSKGYLGMWSHDIAWEQPDQPSFRRLSLGFVELIQHYSEYLSFPLESYERQQSPFII